MGSIIPIEYLFKIWKSFTYRFAIEHYDDAVNAILRGLDSAKKVKLQRLMVKPFKIQLEILKNKDYLR